MDILHKKTEKERNEFYDQSALASSLLLGLSHANLIFGLLIKQVQMQPSLLPAN